MKLLRAATLTTLNPDAAAACYGEWFGYTLAEAGTVPALLAESWGTPGAAGQRYCVCAPASGAPVFLRFVQGDSPDAYRPLRSFGWAAIEICVQDVVAVAARLRDSPFTVIGPPARLDGLPSICAMQVRGPDQEIVFLTQIDADPPGMALPRAGSPVDMLFILVLACSDMAASRRWFAEVMGLEPGPDVALEYGVLSDAFGLAADHKHRIATLSHVADVFLEMDQYPAGAAARPCWPGALPPGVAIATLLAPDMGALRDAPWITRPCHMGGVLYGGLAAGTLRAPDGSLVEVVGVL